MNAAKGPVSRLAPIDPPSVQDETEIFGWALGLSAVEIDVQKALVVNASELLAELKYLFVEPVLARAAIVDVVVDAVRVHDETVEVERGKSARVVEEQVYEPHIGGQLGSGNFRPCHFAIWKLR